ncbi:MAG: phage scaffolding protein [Lachnospirales bacterium]
MKRKFLEDLGIEKDAIDKIMEENGKDIEKAKGDFEDVKAELDTAKNTIAERDNQLKKLQDSNGDNEDLKKQIANLQEENKKAAEKYEEDMKSLKIISAIDNALVKAKAKTPKAVKAMLDMEGIKLDKDGKITGIDEQIKSLCEADDTKYLFESSIIKGAQPGYSNNEPEPEDFSKMNYTEMCAYLEKNPNAKIE